MCRSEGAGAQLPLLPRPSIDTLARPAVSLAKVTGMTVLPRDVDQWLERIGLAKYAPLFAENEVDFDVLPDLTEQDLKDLEHPARPAQEALESDCGA